MADSGPGGEVGEDLVDALVDQVLVVRRPAVRPVARPAAPPDQAAATGVGDVDEEGVLHVVVDEGVLGEAEAGVARDAGADPDGHAVTVPGVAVQLRDRHLGVHHLVVGVSDVLIPVTEVVEMA